MTRNRNRLIGLFRLALIYSLGFLALRAAVPTLLNHQGLIAVNGVNFEGDGEFKFALVSADAGVSYWSNDGTSVAGSEPTAAVTLAVTKGLYAVLLGDTSLPNMLAVPAAVFNHADVRLRVWFNDGSTGSQQIKPDQRLAAAPYALVASQVLLSSIVAPPIKPVLAWGNNHDGQTTVLPLAKVAAVAAGGSQSYALLDDGTVHGWGGAAAVPGGLANVTHIAAGVSHALARKSNGTVQAWGGANLYGERTVPGGIINATAVAAGDKHSLILRADGTVTAFGDDTFGQTPAPAGLTNVVTIAAGNDHCLALRANGTVVAWGSDEAGQVTGTVPILGKILSITSPNSYVLSQPLAAGTSNLGYDGATVVGSTGDGTTAVTADTTSLSIGMVVTGPDVIDPTALTGIVAIGAGAFHSLAVKNDGTVIAWGWGTGGQITVPFGLTGISKVAGGDAFSMALRTDGSVVVWGAPVDANGVEVDAKTIVPDETTEVTAIAAGSGHAVVLRAELISAQVARLDQDNVFTGKIGINRTPTTNALEVEGQASKTTAGNWTANSDRRIKREIQPLTGALEKLDQVQLVDFRYTDAYRAAHPGIADKRYLNVIAQEFAKVFPDHVQGSGEKLPDGSEILQVDTYPLTIYSAAAVQELHRENIALKQQLAGQEERLRKLEALLTK